MSGHAILNIETVFALAAIAVLLWRCGARKPDRQPKLRWAFNARDALGLAVVAILAAAVYWRAAHIPFLSDDFVLVSGAQSFSGNYAPVFTHGGGDGFFRPLGYISLDWTWPLAGLDPIRWHWVGLSLHVLCSLLVYVVGAAIGLARMYAWLASALFAVHAAHPEAAVWIAGRFDLLAALFALVGLIAFIRWWEDASLRWGVVAAAALTLGILSKESAYALPLMMLVYVASAPGTWTRRLRFLAPFFLLAAVLFAYRWTLQGGIGGYVTAEGRPQMFAISIAQSMNALARLWAILFFPVNWPTGAMSWLGAAAIVYACAWAAISWTARGRRRALLVPLGFAFAAAIPPVQQLLIGADLEKARLVYLPSVGFCLLAAAAVEGAAPKMRVIAAVALLAFQAAALLHNLEIWESVTAKSKRVCEAVAACSNADSITDLPRSLNGVYFFANGLPECVRIERSQHPATPLHACSLAWDNKTQELGAAQ